MTWFYMTWFANILILLGLILLGGKNRISFLFTIVGELIWCWCAAYDQLWSLTVICAVFAILAAVNLYRWSRKKEEYALYVGTQDRVPLKFKQVYRIVERYEDEKGVKMLLVFDEINKEMGYPEEYFWIIPDNN